MSPRVACNRRGCSVTGDIAAGHCTASSAEVRLPVFDLLGGRRRRNVRSSPFDALKWDTLAKLDEGFDSLKFLQRLDQVQMGESHFSALMHVCNDYLWTKTPIEGPFHKYPRSRAFNVDKKAFRNKYITRSLMLHTQVGIGCPQNAASELGGVQELLLRSVQCIAHHDSLQASRFVVMKVRLLPTRPKEPDAEFVTVVKVKMDELGD
ncbi:uncharacterized protein LOC144152304 [Haemaphysalis longicornis]